MIDNILDFIFLLVLVFSQVVQHYAERIPWENASDVLGSCMGTSYKDNCCWYVLHKCTEQATQNNEYVSLMAYITIKSDMLYIEAAP